MSAKNKSIITCDMEGIIETFSEGAEKMFGYSSEEVVNKKRVSLFSPGEIVLQNVENWLKEASEKGQYETDTIFLTKEGKPFSAHIKITPTKKDGEQIGYCGVTEVIDEEVEVPIHWSTRLISALVITRLPFITAAATPVIMAAVYSWVTGGGFNWPLFWLTLLGVILLHLGSNVMNDYFDWTSGTDEANTNYFLKYSGGSRAIELGLISEKGTRTLGLILLACAFLVGLYLTYIVGMGVLLIGLAGLFLGYCYTAPPIRLVARKGLGEIAIALAFGPLITFGTYYVLNGTYDIMSFLIGVPVGLLTANILLINEFPDMEGDASTGKNHLVVIFGKEKSINIYKLILYLAVIGTVILSWLLDIWGLLLPALVTGVIGWQIVKYIRKYYQTRELVKANVRTINLQLVYSFLFIAGLLLDHFL